MCMQVDYLFACGHRGFARVENCLNFGNGTCYGAGAVHRDELVGEICSDCKVRNRDTEHDARSYDHHRKKQKKSSSGIGKGKRRRDD
jgi:hypothetical protein